MLLTKNEYLAIQKATTDYLTIQGVTKLVVIDPRIEAPHQQLAKDVPADTKVLLLDLHQDSIAQITRALAEGNYHSLYLISPGSTGCLHLGKTNLSSATIAQYKQQLLEWRIAEIFIYDFDIVANYDLLIILRALTGANILTSPRKMG